jgi:hypothetical protein
LQEELELVEFENDIFASKQNKSSLTRNLFLQTRVAKSIDAYKNLFLFGYMRVYLLFSFKNLSENEYKFM